MSLSEDREEEGMSSRSKPCAEAGTHIPPSPQTYTIELGLARRPLADQLSSQGLPFDPETIKHLDLDAGAASRLKARGVLTYSAGERVYDKLVKQICAEVRRAIRATETQSPAGGEG